MIYLSLGLQKGRASNKRSLQLTKEAFSSQKRTSSTSTHEIFSTFAICPPGSGFRIRIHWPDWIRIQLGSGSATLVCTCAEVADWSWCWAALSSSSLAVSSWRRLPITCCLFSSCWLTLTVSIYCTRLTRPDQKDSTKVKRKDCMEKDKKICMEKGRKDGMEPDKNEWRKERRTESRTWRIARMTGKRV